ncbi:hypothetical protein KCU88_g7043, partial [Aureobasidium melanogenum]
MVIPSARAPKTQPTAAALDSAAAPRTDDVPSSEEREREAEVVWDVRLDEDMAEEDGECSKRETSEVAVNKRDDRAAEEVIEALSELAADLDTDTSAALVGCIWEDVDEASMADKSDAMTAEATEAAEAKIEVASV